MRGKLRLIATPGWTFWLNSRCHAITNHVTIPEFPLGTLVWVKPYCLAFPIKAAAEPNTIQNKLQHTIYDVYQYLPSRAWIQFSFYHSTNYLDASLSTSHAPGFALPIANWYFCLEWSGMMKVAFICVSDLMLRFNRMFTYALLRCVQASFGGREWMGNRARQSGFQEVEPRTAYLAFHYARKSLVRHYRLYLT